MEKSDSVRVTRLSIQHYKQPCVILQHRACTESYARWHTAKHWDLFYKTQEMNLFELNTRSDTSKEWLNDSNGNFPILQQPSTYASVALWVFEDQLYVLDASHICSDLTFTSLGFLSVYVCVCLSVYEHEWTVGLKRLIRGTVAYQK